MELNEWVRKQIAARGGKQKSINLPAHCPESIATVERLLKQPLSADVAETGELPDGVTIEPQHESFYVK